MTCYRVAFQHDHSSTWEWQSMELASLDEVRGFLELHDSITRHHMRVFYSSSVAYLDVMLTRENQGLISNSLTAEYVLNGSARIDPFQMQLFESFCDPDPLMGSAVASLLAAHIWHMRDQHAPDQESTNTLEMRRYEGVMEANIDQDSPYTFTLPHSLPQVLAWTRLLARVQRGELAP
jgi:hypothetical protein